jgi:hypothetical protein
MRVTLENNMPNFNEYKVSIDGRGWRTRPDQFDWELKDNINSIKAKAINKFGVAGPTSRLKVKFAR